LTSDFTASGAGSKTLTLAGSSTAANTIGGAIVNNSVANTTALTKSGAGTWAFTGASTYNGNTTISAGTLALSGSASINNSPNIIDNATLDVSGHIGGAYTLASGQTLKGNGGVNGTIVVSSGATVAPGTSIGTLYFTNTPTLSGTTSMEINRSAAPNADKLVVVTGGGTLAFGGTLSVANLGATLQLNATFDLFYSFAFSGSLTTQPSGPADHPV
jgi:autotransporter-associated beta strand protein